MAADLVVRVRTDTTQAISGLDALLGKISRLSGVTAVASSVTAVASAFSMLGTVAQTVSTAVSQVVNAAMTQIRAERELEAAVSQVGQRYGVSAEAIKAYAAEVQKATNFGDEQVIQISAMLVRFGLAGDVLRRTIDISADLAQALGMDLTSAAELVGRALVEPDAAMRRLRTAGIAFTDSQKETIEALVESGRVAEAQAQILSMLESHYSNAAESAVEPTKQAQNAFGDMLEELGIAVLELVNPIAQVLVPLLSDVLTPIIKALAQVLNVTLVPAINLVTKALGWVINIVGQAVQGIIDVIARIYAWYSRVVWGVEMAGDAGQKAGADIADGFGKAETAIASATGAAQKFSEAQKRAQTEAMKFLEDLARREAVLRWGEDAVKLLEIRAKLSQAGFKPQEVDAIIERLFRVEAAEAAQKAAEEQAKRRAEAARQAHEAQERARREAASRAERIRDEIATPMDQLMQKLQEARSLYLGGQLTRAEYAAYIEKQRREIFERAGAMRPEQLPRYAAAIQRGQAGAFSELLKALRPTTQRNFDKETADNTRELVAVLERFINELKNEAI